MIYQMLVSRANYAASERCKIGQTIINLTELSKETGWSRDILSGALKQLKKEGYIQTETLPQKKGVLVTIVRYKDLQDLTFYQKEKGEKEPKNPQGNPQRIPHENPQGNPQGSEPANPCYERDDEGLEKANPQGNPHEIPQGNPHENPHTITAFINSISNSNININKTLKQYVDQSGVKKMNLSSTEDIGTFVDFALLTNAFPAGASRKVLIAYFDVIRMTRSSCSISAKVLANFIEKLKKYSVNQIHYAFLKHITDHDDKREQYTLGILRNVKEPEARRGLMILKNKKGVASHGLDGNLPAAAGAEESSTRAEAERLERIARERGLLGAIRDTEFDF
ncbi:hypothetical protein BTO30_02760 [Domibacillus antri]|uniref:Uncharacterized protein n=2 Tax=Domibacillus antri TaxID=1714264 RepID=A0A1Q8Q959_9BACI|nr:hypothetical protein BTO30_02760 [Domibacillus antri]